MSYPDAGKVDLEKWETASTADTINDAQVPISNLAENQSIKDDEKDYGITRLRSRPELKAVVPTALRPTLSRTVSRITNRDVVDPGPAPDGGVKAWTQVACAWMICVTTWGYVNSFGVFQTYYTERLGETRSTVSWVGSIQLWVIFVMSAFSGRALDAGLFIPTLIVGSFIQLIGIFVTSLCRNFWQLLLAQGLCTGLGSGIIFCPAMGLVTTYFTRKRALAIAIVTTGNSFGGGVYPVVVRQLLPKIGFPWTVRILGFLNMAFLLAAIAFMRPRLPPRKSGPVIEWQAFREFPYVSLIVGFSFVFGALFFSYYFVSSCLPVQRFNAYVMHRLDHTAAMLLA